MNIQVIPHATATLSRFGRLLPLLSLPWLSHHSIAQEASGEDEVVELSPFVVSADETGWYATETLSGSRMRTSFDDVASQIEVLTMEFMDDFGVNSVEEASIYSLNLENNSEWVPTGFTNGVGRQSLNDGIRVRGLSSATLGRDFFDTYFPSDNYNLSRVTISSGPNAILFGTGSPGGIINTTLARAVFNDLGSIKIQFDDWGSERYEFMVNRNVIDDVLAVRVAALYEDKRFDIRPSNERSRRLYATFNYQPFKHTSISVHAEQIKVESRRPSRRPAYDQISVWATAGDLAAQGLLSGAYGNEHIFDNDAAWIAAGRPIADNAVFTLPRENPYFVFGANPAGVPVLTSYENTVETRPPMNVGSDNEPYLDPVNTPPAGTTFLDDTYYPTDTNWLYNTEYELDRETIYNVFFNQRILPGLDFEFAWQREGYSDSDSAMMGGQGGAQLKVDANRYLPDGVTQNPYAGEYYFDGYPQYNLGERDRDEYRATLAYRFDFAEHFDRQWIRYLGRHSVAGLYNVRQSESMIQQYFPAFLPKFDETTGQYYDPLIANFEYLIPGRVLLGEVVDPSSGNSTYGASSTNWERRLGFRSYVSLRGESNIPTDGFDLVRDPVLTFTDANGEAWTIDPQNAAIGTNGERLVTGGDANGVKDKVTTHQISYNGSFLDGRVVYTFGWRKDEIRAGLERSPEFTWLNLENGDSSTTGGFVPHRSLYTYDYGTPDESNDSGITRYHGVVLHPFRGRSMNLPWGADLSLHYSKSGTFQANTGFVDADGNNVPGEEGDGRDYGFTLSLFDGKFGMRYNDYKVTSNPATGSFDRIRGAVRPTVRNMLYGFGAADPNGDGIPAFRDYDEFVSIFPDWPMLNDPTADPRRIYPFDASGNFVTGDFGDEIENYQTLSSSVATGREITVRYSPTRNLDIRVTYSEQEVVDTDIAARWVQWVDEFIDMMDNSPSGLFVEGYNPADNQAQFRNPNGFDMDGLDIDPNDGLAPGIDYFRWDQIENGGGENSRNLTTPNRPWGQNVGNPNPATATTPGVVVTNPALVGANTGWGNSTLREQFIGRAVNGATGTSVIRGLDGRANDFNRSERYNINAMYRFSEGVLKGTSVGLAYRWRAAPVISLQALPNINPDGTQEGFLPDSTQLIRGDVEDAVDLTLGYAGRSSWFGGTRYTIRGIVRNLFPESDRLIPTAIDTLNGNTLTAARVDGRQYIVSLELKF